MDFALNAIQKEAITRWDDFDPDQLASQSYVAGLKFGFEFIAKDVAYFDYHKKFDHTLWSKAGALGFSGTTVVEEKHGGSNIGYLGMGPIIESIAEYDAGTALSLLANTTLCINPIQTHGNEDQKNRHLYDLAKGIGNAHGAIGMTEPERGSDAGDVRMSATKADGGWLLNGEKTFITNGGTAKKIVTFARTAEATGQDKPNHLTAFIVTQEELCPTITSTKLDKGGMWSSETWSMHFNNHFVPDEDVLGGVGNGQFVMFSNLPLEREMLAEIDIGNTRAAYQTTKDYLCTRMQFGKRLIDIPVIRHQMADLREQLAQAEDHVCRLVTRAEKGRLLPEHKSRYEYMQNKDGLVKNSVNAMSTHVIGECITLCGGNGFMEEMGLMRRWRNSKLNAIGGGANNIVNISSWRDNGYTPTK